MNDRQMPEDEGPPPTSLSRAGMIRREEILTLARRAGRKRAVRATAARIGGIALLGLLVTVGIIAVLHPTNTNSQMGLGKPEITIPRPIAPGPMAGIEILPPLPQASQIEITWIATKPGITDRLAVPPAAPIWTRLTDSELMQDIAATGQPGGLAYVNDRPVLLFPF